MSSFGASLPIEPHLPRLLDRLAGSGALVLLAEPGAGKTTRLPVALLEDERFAGGCIWVVEPRRLAATVAARFVAASLGERVGERVGYRVRFERAESARTRLTFLTDGVALRALAASRDLPNVSVVLLDEVHERRWETDLLLALLAELRRRRPALRLVAMSATMRPEGLARTLRTPVERIEGRAHPVRIRHASRAEASPLPQRAARAVAELLEEPGGDVLVFLPGMKEIDATAARLRAVAERTGAVVCRLHGSLSAEEQERALSSSERRKVVLSSAVAETSLTVPGVTAVVDGGLSRRVRFDPWTGLGRLVTEPASRATAAQRAGRAGRLGPGCCVRLFTEAEWRERPEQDPPAVRTAELSELRLVLASMGMEAEALPWWTPPPEESLARAETLLRRLGAMDETGEATPLGRRMLRLPLPARLARLLLEGEARGCGFQAALLAAWLSEADSGRLRPEEGVDVWEVCCELLRREAEHSLPRSISRTAKRLRRMLRPRGGERASSEAVSEALGAALLAAFPDRLARRLGPVRADLAMVDGGGARLPAPEALGEAVWMVVVGAQAGRKGAVRVTRAMPIEPETVLDVLEGSVQEEETVRVGPPPRGAAERRLLLRVGRLLLDESRRPAEPGEATSAALREAMQSWSLSHWLPDPERFEVLRRRLDFARRFVPGLPVLDEAVLRERAEALCDGAVALEQVRAADPLACLIVAWPPETMERLERLAPEHVVLPGRRKPVRVHYEPGRPPWVAAPIQAFFGLDRTPRVADGRVPLVLHLLAPNGRAVQVTSDLPGFWMSLYPRVRRELGRRYPRHRWLQDPTARAGRSD